MTRKNPSIKNNNFKNISPISASTAPGSRKATARKKSAQSAAPKHPGNSISPRKKPRQTRSRQMVAAIEQAAAEMFARHGYAGTTTNKVAERAGVSVGSLYQYFPSKDSLLAVLWERHHSQIHQIVGECMIQLQNPAVPLEDTLRELIHRLLELHRADPDLTRALSSIVLQESSLADKHHEEQETWTHARQLSALLGSRPDVRPGDHLSMAAIVATVVGQLTRWLSHDVPPGLDQDALAEEAVQILVRYLRS